MRSVLFNEGSLIDLLYAYERKLPQEITDLEGKKVLASSFTDLCTYFEDRYRLEIPTLKLDQAHVLPPEDTKIALSPHESQFYDYEPGLQVAGTLFSLVVPFDGDRDLFKYLPNSFFMTHVDGAVTADGTALLLSQVSREPDATNVRAAFDGRIKTIEQYLQTQRQQVADWNARLPELVKTLLEQRRQKALSAMSVTESLGFPLKRRESSTYEVPMARKKLAQIPTARPAPYIPEPALALKQYDEILGVIASLAIAMERSPSAFASMGEEHLRDHLLAILNTQFEGKATGETFNKSGKTDILIRENDRSVFIAECKVWDGPKTLSAALDQILSYACWRDSKLAVILFNRRKDFSSVLGAIPETVRAHPQLKRQVDYPVEGGYRFTFGQKDDRNRELTITVLAFDVPSPEPIAAPDPAPKAVVPAPRPAPRPARPPRRP